MRTITDIRRSNLEIVLNKYCARSRTQLAMRLNMSPAQVSHLFTGFREIGHSVARRLEQACGLPVGWMDNDHEGDDGEQEILDIYRRLPDRDKSRAIGILKTLAD